jgi:8-oxo-dGTP pyrophosphatase MutT (NUDIX family)
MVPVYGVSALIGRPDGYVLAVSRRNDPHDLSLPGGKVEPGERPIDAAVRELWEETWVRAVRVAPVFDSILTTKRAMTFAVPEWTGEPRSTDEGAVYWAPPSWLVDELSPTFRNYNIRLFTALGIRFDQNRRLGRGQLRHAFPGHAFAVR